jgi:hypothetical protein
LPPTDKNSPVIGDRSQQTRETLLARFPELDHLQANTIYITRAIYLPALMTAFQHYRVVMIPISPYADWFKLDKESYPIAFIPLSLHD